MANCGQGINTISANGGPEYTVENIDFLTGLATVPTVTPLGSVQINLQYFPDVLGINGSNQLTLANGAELWSDANILASTYGSLFVPCPLGELQDYPQQIPTTNLWSIDNFGDQGLIFLNMFDWAGIFASVLAGSSLGDMVLAAVQTVTGTKTFNTGTLRLAGSTSGNVILNTASTTTSYTITLPSAQGGAGTALVNDGAGNLSWTSVSSGWTQGGNSFGATGRLGTNDAFSLILRSNNTDKIELDTAGNFFPSTDNAQDLGSATKRWKDLYLTGATLYFDTVVVKTLSGTPNGTTTAPKASLVLDTSNAALWVKSTATGNTGWVSAALNGGNVTFGTLDSTGATNLATTSGSPFLAGNTGGTTQIEGSTITFGTTPFFPLLQGSILIGGALGVAGTLAIGTTGKVLTSDGTTASWQTLPAATKLAEYFDAVTGTTVTLANTPTFIYGVYKNGLLQRVGGSRDITISGATITFLVALAADNIAVVYEY